jgi:hypothetical protein
MWNAWYTVYDNDPSKAPALLATIDDACSVAGRPGSAVAKTLAMLVQFESEPVHRQAVNRIGERGGMIEALHRLEAAGVDTVQLVLDPISLATIEEVADIVREWQTG